MGQIDQAQNANLKMADLSSDLLNGGHQPRQAFCWYDTDYKIVLCEDDKNCFIVGFISTEAFFWCDNDKDLDTC